MRNLASKKYGLDMLEPHLRMLEQVWEGGGGGGGREEESVGRGGSAMHYVNLGWTPVWLRSLVVVVSRTGLLW